MTMRLLINVLPSLAVNNAPDILLGLSVLASNLSKACAFCEATYFSHVIFGQGRVAIFAAHAWGGLTQAGFVGVQRIASTSYPFEVFHSVIFPIAVFVINLITAGCLRQKSECHQSVYPLQGYLPILTQSKLKIPVSRHSLSDTAAHYALAFVYALNSAMRRDLISFFVAGNSPPFFIRGIAHE